MKKYTIKCTKCNGTGYIDGFMHVANGECFDCHGSGFLPEPKKTTLKFSIAFINQYQQKGFFPEDTTQMIKDVAISSIGHATAEQWLLHDSEYYYIGKPVCRASGWYKIPKSDIVDFLKNYNHAYKHNISI